MSTPLHPRHPGTLILLGLPPETDDTLPTQPKKQVTPLKLALLALLAIPGSLAIPAAALAALITKKRRKGNPS
jgi:hypothetical protein